MPPRHGKTETLLHAIAWWLVQDPTLTIGYVSYGSEQATSKSRKARSLAQSAGLQLAPDAQRLEEWRTLSGGGVLATGIGGGLTGQGVDVLLVDDPVKNRVEAESSTQRERVWEWFTDVGYTRLEPNGSIVVVQTRWHPDDLSGRLIDGGGWERLNLPAIDGEGRALWPERWPAETLLKTRTQVGEYTWASLYQGEPRARGGSVFGDVTTYDVLPSDLRYAIGLDLAYTARTQADYSVAVVLGFSQGRYYVLDVQRLQVQASVFAVRLKALRRLYPTARFHWYTSTTEQGLAQLLGGQGVPVQAQLARGDKFVRAQGVSAAWNAGRVLVPKNAPWLDAFLAELASFTGLEDDHDDQVDALASAYDSLTVAHDALARLKALSTW